MTDSVTDLLTAGGEDFLKERNLVGRNFKRGVSVLEKKYTRDVYRGWTKINFGRKGHKEKNSGN